MNLLERAWTALHTNFLGGGVAQTLGAVEGNPSIGTTADLQKASGEIRVHAIRTADAGTAVTLELPQHELPGDSSEMVCVQLTAANAERLGELLGRAASVARDGARD